MIYFFFYFIFLLVLWCFYFLVFHFFSFVPFRIRIPFHWYDPSTRICFVCMARCSWQICHIHDWLSLRSRYFIVGGSGGDVVDVIGIESVVVYRCGAIPPRFHDYIYVIMIPSVQVNAMDPSLIFREAMKIVFTFIAIALFLCHRSLWIFGWFRSFFCITLTV